ncbi:MAG: hypothetical protein KDC98_08480 [Planctomycetes bacterium]|nr:hypothetical protein [Planctomycetota bacterium]
MRPESTRPATPLRIGGVPYGVGAPLLAGLDDQPGVTFVSEPPTRLITMLRAGELDAALVSSVEAVRGPDYRVAAGLGIACRQEIRSVRAFRRRGAPIARVGLDQSSATSVALLRLLLQNVHRDSVADEVRFETITPTVRPDELPHDLVLLIGDTGLRADAGDREVWDLGAEWVGWTGLPFVFAVWLLGPGADADAILPLLHTARERGRGLGAIDGTHGAAHYDLDGRDLDGLRRFWTECRAAGLATVDDARLVGPGRA